MHLCALYELKSFPYSVCGIEYMVTLSGQMSKYSGVDQTLPVDVYKCSIGQKTYPTCSHSVLDFIFVNHQLNEVKMKIY